MPGQTIELSFFNAAGLPNTFAPSDGRCTEPSEARIEAENACTNAFKTGDSLLAYVSWPRRSASITTTPGSFSSVFFKVVFPEHMEPVSPIQMVVEKDEEADDEEEESLMLLSVY